MTHTRGCDRPDWCVICMHDNHQASAAGCNKKQRQATAPLSLPPSIQRTASCADRSSFGAGAPPPPPPLLLPGCFPAPAGAAPAAPPLLLGCAGAAPAALLAACASYIARQGRGGSCWLTRELRGRVCEQSATKAHITMSSCITAKQKHREADSTCCSRHVRQPQRP